MTILSVFFLELLLKTDIICQKVDIQMNHTQKKLNFFFWQISWRIIAINRYCLILSVITMRRHSGYKMFKSLQSFYFEIFKLSIRVNNWILRIIVLMVHGSTKHYNNNNLSFLSSFTLLPFSLSTALTYSFSLNCSFFVFLYVNISILALLMNNSFRMKFNSSKQ